MVMLSLGDDPADPSAETVQRAADKVAEEKDNGQIRRFTGNDYADDLASGNVAIAQAYSGDVVQLQADNPDLQFVVPEAGGTTFVDPSGLRVGLADERTPVLVAASRGDSWESAPPLVERRAGEATRPVRHRCAQGNERP